tara:strand:- start:1769 stop:3436 length:1668 start_codon:yes stop_codon:yes gene_type:complete
MAPIFVGSNSDDSKIKLDRVSVAASTADPGSASVGDAYYNSSDNNLKFYNGSGWSAAKGSGTADFVASGTLANGQAVILTSDGKVSGINSIGVAHTVGTPVEFESGETSDISSCYDVKHNRIIICYRDGSNSAYGTAVVGTLDKERRVIDFGTPEVFHSTSTDDIHCCFDLNRMVTVVAYRNTSNNYGMTCLLEVNPQDNSFHNKNQVTFDTGHTRPLAIEYSDFNRRFVILYRDGDDSYKPYVVCGEVTSTSAASFGSPVNVASYNSIHGDLVYIPSTDLFCIAYQDSNNSYRGKFRVFEISDVSNNTINFPAGSANIESSGGESRDFSLTYDSGNDRVICAYGHDGGTNAGFVAIPTIPGGSEKYVTAVSTPVRFSDDASPSVSITDIAAVYDTDAQRTVISYRDAGTDPYRGKTVSGIATGNDINFDIPNTVIFAQGNTIDCSAVYVPISKRVVISYKNWSSSPAQKGTSAVYESARTDLTEEKFIGFSNDAYTNGQTATVQIISTVDDAQVGLTTGEKHFVQRDGSLSTIEDDPSVFAGTAISGTKISVKH